jgi:serine/threonine protein kinase/tetratricopeptide (TPR) repeat protein
MDSLDDIFLKAREIADLAERAAYLDQACAGDPALRASVDRMLRDAEGAEEFFGEEESDLTTPTDKIEQAGTVIGRYKLLQKIGEGGMGVVFMAEQREPVIRKVALKIIKLGMDTRQVVARFEAERQTLALMDHPNIAKVLDGGATETGRSYFVMELVQGLPITQFCDEASLATRERLTLFLDVCSAIQHAHQKGIIHRDIKPSNILVALHGDKPVPKVIDFGVAKATQGRLTDKTVFTQFQHFIGTPAYMSPEQASLSGLDVDTRSDIYGLGVLLYELLTGKTPFEAKELLKAGLDQMRRLISEQEPPKPSTRLSTLEGQELTKTAHHRHTEAPKLIHQVRGDLDWIVMKCLEKDRTRRYETANGLATDVQRHLGNEPVFARPPTTMYRLQKAIRRNRLTVIAGAGIAFALLAGTLVSAWQAARAKTAERESKAQAEAARTIKEFLVEQLLGPVNPLVDPVYDPNKRGVVEGIARAIEGRFANEPLIEAEVRFAIGDAFAGLWEYGEASAQQERVLALRKRLLASGDPAILQAAIKLAEAYFQTGRMNDAARLLDETILVARASPGGPTKELGQALYEKGYLLNRDGRAAQAVPCLNEAVQVLAKSAGETNFDIGWARIEIARATQTLGRTNEAEQLWKQGIERSQLLYGLTHPVTTAFQRSLAIFYVRQGRAQEGLAMLEQLLSEERQTMGPDHNLTLNTEFWQGRTLEQLGHIDKAAAVFASLPHRLSKYFPFDPVREECVYVARFFARHRQRAEARAAFELITKSLEASSLERAVQVEWLITATAATKGWTAAAAVCRTNFDAFRQAPELWRAKAAALAYAGDDEWYRKAAGQALALVSSATNWNDRIAIAQAAARGPLHPSTEQSNQCEPLMAELERALPIATTNQMQQGHRAIAALRFRLEQPVEALTHLAKSLQFQPASIDRASTLFLQSLCYNSLGRADEAREALAAGEAIQKSLLPEPLVEYEGFLTEPERNCVMLHREAQRLVKEN